METKTLIRLEVNGDPYEVRVKNHWTLLELLREGLGLTGSKLGCGTGDCGACCVILDGRAVNACLVLAVEADGRAVTTIEGLGRSGNLHPIQDAFVRYGAVQCGACIPGVIVSAKAYLDRHPRPTEAGLRDALGGNFCRCTGYAKIIEAILAVAHGEVAAGGR